MSEYRTEQGGAGTVPVGDRDLSSVLSYAQQFTGSDSSHHGLLGQALSLLQDKHASGSITPGAHVNEQEIISAHQKVEHGGNTNPDELGMGAALEALKMFSKGQAGGSGHSNEFVALAMSQAAKMFDKKHAEGQMSFDGSQTQAKQSAIEQAGEMALKMYMKSKTDTSGGGHSAQSASSSGSMGNLMDMAQMFLKK